MGCSYFFIDKIIMEGASYLNPGGWLLIEMDPRQTPNAINMLEQSGYYEKIRGVKDYSQKDRVVMARKNRAHESHNLLQ